MIAVTGATGHLGRLVIDALLERGVRPGEVAALARRPEKAADLAERGVAVREADYSKPETLETALQGVDRLLLVSSSEVGQRVEQHGNVVEAARKAGVGFIGYTSILRAGTSPMQLAVEHRATEALIRASGLPFAFLRNGWYIENYTERMDRVLTRGALFGSAGEGRVSAATRADFAEAAAVVLTSEGHEGAVYELGGDEAFTLRELAEEITRQSGTEVIYRDLPEEAYLQALTSAGVPESFAAVLADTNRSIAQGHLYDDSGDLSRLLGRPTTSMPGAVADALSS